VDNLASVPVTQAVEAQGWVGARVTLGNQTDYGVFRTFGDVVAEQAVPSSGSRLHDRCEPLHGVTGGIGPGALLRGGQLV
jgi:hypothetical protein